MSPTHYCAHKDERRYPQHLFVGMQRGEALASSLGVVAYDHAAAGELIEDGHNGRLVSSPVRA
ncbi:hypothetical protein [Georgfuchsia toluolica]|uniref:hypothetical protein n=1 Tax=Georgfuchsia toluolica TaxID=424218 RepID=UPI001C736E2A|nr:hypothetical protein [Georgfuchsia toluolica]